jgi:tyrosyl-tRNA synthetase
MWSYINLLIFKSGSEIQQMKNAVLQGANPRDIKIDFAKEIVTRFHDETQAKEAHQHFIERFQKGIIPEDLEELTVLLEEPLPLAQLLKQVNLTQTTSESIRLIKQGGVKIDSNKVADPTLALALGQTYIIQVGKRRIAKVLLQKAV